MNFLFVVICCVRLELMDRSASVMIAVVGCWFFFGVVVVVVVAVKASIMCSLVLDAVSATKDISKLQIAHTIQEQ